MCEILVFEKVVWQLIARKKRLVKQHSKFLLIDYFPPMKFKFNMKEGFEIIGALSYTSVFRLLQVPWTILNRLHSKFINLFFFSFLFFISIFYLFIHFPLSSSSLSRSSFFFFFNNFNNHQRRRLRKQCINRITVLITML